MPFQNPVHCFSLYCYLLALYGEKKHIWNPFRAFSDLCVICGSFGKWMVPYLFFPFLTASGPVQCNNNANMEWIGQTKTYRLTKCLHLHVTIWYDIAFFFYFSLKMATCYLVPIDTRRGAQSKTVHMAKHITAYKYKAIDFPTFI